jgi:hypothetical protein
MNKAEASPNTKNMTKYAKQFGKAGLAAAVILGAEQATPASAHEKHLSVAALTKKAEARINAAKPFSVFNGTLVRTETRSTGGTLSEPSSSGGKAYTNGKYSFTMNTLNPVAIDSRHPDKPFDHADIRSSDYFGSLSQDKAGKVHVTLHKFNAATMQLVPNIYSEQPISSVAFTPGKALGAILFDQPITSLDGHPDKHGGPYQDPAGNTAPVALDYNPQAKG